VLGQVGANPGCVSIMPGTQQSLAPGKVSVQL